MKVMVKIILEIHSVAHIYRKKKKTKVQICELFVGKQSISLYHVWKTECKKYFYIFCNGGWTSKLFETFFSYLLLFKNNFQKKILFAYVYQYLVICGICGNTKVCLISATNLSTFVSFNRSRNSYSLEVSHVVLQKIW